MSSNIKDARVLAAFKEKIQRPYMLGVEQRLTDAVDYITEQQTNGVTLTKSTLVGSGQFTTTSTTYVDTTLEINLVCSGGKTVYVFFSWDDFWISSTTSDIAYVAISVDGGTEEVLATTYKVTANSNTYGVCAVAGYLGVSAGIHNYKIRAKTSGGTLYLGTSSGNKLLLAVMEV